MKKLLFPLAFIIFGGCKKDDTPADYTFKGILVHQKDNKPIAGAKVFLAIASNYTQSSTQAQSGNSTTTNENGEYSFSFSRHEIEIENWTITGYYLAGDKNGLVSMFRNKSRSVLKHNQDTVFMDNPSYLKLIVKPNSFGANGQLYLEWGYTNPTITPVARGNGEKEYKLPASNDTLISSFSYREYKKAYIQIAYSLPGGSYNELPIKEVALDSLQTKEVTIEK